LIPSPPHAVNRIGDAGAAAVAGALEPRRNGDGSWTPSTALTGLWLGAHVATHLAYPNSAGNKLGDEGKKAVREAVSAHNDHLPPGMKKLQIYI